MEQLWERDWRVSMQANRRKHWGYFSYMKSSNFTKMHELGNTARDSVVTLLLFLRLALLVALALSLRALWVLLLSCAASHCHKLDTKTVFLVYSSAN